MSRAVLRQGDTGPDVEVLQRHLGVAVDGVFGLETKSALLAWQAIRHLVADGVAGEKTWRAMGEQVAPYHPSSDPRAPACLAALRDASAKWPNRSRISDGIMGDARHQASKSDHNLGNAVDITHDINGPAGGDLAMMAMLDQRVSYIIWDRRIWNPDRASEGWRPYTGSNPHTHHVHISIKAHLRNDDSPWPWA